MTRKFAIGTVRFQEGSRIVERGDGPVRLSHAEYIILLSLCSTGVYRDDSARRIDNVVFRLRRKLGLEAQIVADWHRGYRILNAVQLGD